MKITKENYKNYYNARKKEMDCNGLGITEINYVPDGCKSLRCFDNKLTKLPSKLPKTLTSINCNNNQIVKLPKFAKNSLISLNCKHNLIEEIDMPLSLEELDCSNNNIKKIGIYSINIDFLYCNDNPIESIGGLKYIEDILNYTERNLYGFNLSNTKLVCKKETQRLIRM